MTLVAGREIAAHGIPHTESLITLAAGDRWIDQQWLAQIAWYGVHEAGGLPAVALLDALLVATTYGSAMAAARLLGAGQRAAFLVATVCLFVAPWSWQVRAQAFALPLFVWVLWLAADHVRRPSRRLLAALPLLLLWANLHGSVLLGAGITALAALWCLPRVRGSRADVILGVGIAVAAPLCVLATPYGLDIVDYYRLLILDPPFGHEIIEWQHATPGAVTALFYAVAASSAALVAWQRRRLTWFEITILVVLFLEAVQAVRGIAWFTLAVAVFVPNAVEGAIRRPDVVRHRRTNALFAGVAVAAAVVMLGAAAAKPRS